MEATVTGFDLGFLNGHVSIIYHQDGATIDEDRFEEGKVVALADEAI